MTGPRVVRAGTSPTGAHVVGDRSRGVHVTVNVADRDFLADTANAPTEVPLVLVKGTDGLLRPRQLAAIDVGDHTHPDPWGDRVRFAAADPAPDDDAPRGAVHVNTATGRVFRKEDLQA